MSGVADLVAGTCCLNCGDRCRVGRCDSWRPGGEGPRHGTWASSVTAAGDDHCGREPTSGDERGAHDRMIAKWAGSSKACLPNDLALTRGPGRPSGSTPGYAALLPPISKCIQQYSARPLRAAIYIEYPSAFVEKVLDSSPERSHRQSQGLHGIHSGKVGVPSFETSNLGRTAPPQGRFLIRLPDAGPHTSLHPVSRLKDEVRCRDLAPECFASKGCHSITASRSA